MLSHLHTLKSLNIFQHYRYHLYVAEKIRNNGEWVKNKIFFINSPIIAHDFFTFIYTTELTVPILTISEKVWSP